MSGKHLELRIWRSVVQASLLDKELYSTLCLLTQARVVQTLDSTIHPINHYPVDKLILGKLIVLSSG